MPRTFPSQITTFLRTTLGNYDVFGKGPIQDSALAQEKIGALVAFIDLYDNLSEEIIPIEDASFAELVMSIGEARFGIEQYRNGGKAETSLASVGPAIVRAWKVIEKLPDELPSASQDLTFIVDSEIREMIGLDLSAISVAIQSGEWKGATVLAGSCAECALLYGIRSKDSKLPGSLQSAMNNINWSKRPNPTDLEDRSWDLFSYTAVSSNMKIIIDTTKFELGALREYRNLIHPGKSLRSKMKYDRGTAYVSMGALLHVIRDLKDHL